MTTEQAYKAPRRIWHWNRGPGCRHYVLSAHSLTRWEFSNGCRGSSARTPVGAFVRWLKWRNEKVLPHE